MNQNAEAVCLTCGLPIPVQECPYAWGCPKGIEAELPPKPQEILGAFEQVAALAGLRLPANSIRVVSLAAPHRRPALPPQSQAVYSFFLENRCLKVGKAGPKSPARYSSHHYGLHARSTLARSVLDHREQIASLVEWRAAEIRALNGESVGPWIEANTRRLDFLLPTNAGSAALALLETFLQARFNPVFEG